MDELYQYTYNKILQDKNRQEPQLWADGVVDKLVIARNPFFSEREQSSDITFQQIGNYVVAVTGNCIIRLPNLLLKNGEFDGYISQGFDKNLMLMPSDFFQKIVDTLEKMNAADPTMRMLRRLILGNAYKVSTNKNNQLRIPMNLMSFMGGPKIIVIVGNGGYLEIWGKNEWESQKQEIAGHALEMGNLLRSVLTK